MPKGPIWKEDELNRLRDYAADPKNRRWKDFETTRSYHGVVQKAKELKIQLIGPKSITKQDKRYKKPEVKTYWIQTGLEGCVFDMEPATKRQHWSPKYESSYSPIEHHLSDIFRAI
jgi:hypothetical protein